jgi:predicted GTPase
LRTHKFGIAIPKTVAEALDLDRISGTTHWRDALNLKVKIVEVAFQVGSVGFPIHNNVYECCEQEIYKNWTYISCIK